MGEKKKKSREYEARSAYSPKGKTGSIARKWGRKGGKREKRRGEGEKGEKETSGKRDRGNLT